MNFYNSTPTQVFEVIGVNKGWILCHAISLEDAIAQFEASHPNDIVLEIRRFAPQEAQAVWGDRVMVLRSQWLKDGLHHEIEPNTWVSDRDLIFTQGAIAA